MENAEKSTDATAIWECGSVFVMAVGKFSDGENRWGLKHVVGHLYVWLCLSCKSRFLKEMSYSRLLSG